MTVANFRLTNHIRECILSQLVSGAFTQRVAKVNEDHKNLAYTLYTDAMSKREKEVVDMKIHGLLPTAHYIRVGVGEGSGSVVGFNFDGRESYIPGNLQAIRSRDTVKLPVPFRFINGVAKIYDPDSNMGRKIKKYREDVDTLIKEYNELRAATWGTLQAFNTSKQAVEAWPELEPELLKHQPTPGNKAVSYPISELNSKLGL